MKKLIAVLVVALTTSLLSGCATRAQEAALVGGLVGFGVGATVPRPAPSPRVMPGQVILVPVAPAVGVTAEDEIVYSGKKCLRRDGTKGRDGTLNGNAGCFKL